MKKLFVGNTDLQLSIEAKKFSPEAVLIQQINLSNLSEIQVGYISLGDHNSADFVKALDTAQELYYIPSDSWDHPDTKLHTEFWLRYYSHRKTVGNFQIQSNTNDLLELVDYRKTSDQQIWVAGDSFTQGVPWVKHNQTYGYLLGERLSLPVSVLAQGGSSISWAADQILRSDIRPNDIVVFMLTAVHRFPYYDTKLKHIYPHSWQLDPSLSNTINENILASDHLLYLAIRSIEQVKQAAVKQGYTLVITKSPLDRVEHEFKMLEYLSHYKYFVHHYLNATDKLIDYGNDGQHPGPKQHEFYAKTILDFMKQSSII